MYFQVLDDKKDCLGIYADGELHYDEFPEGLTRTWRGAEYLTDPNIEYAFLHADGKTIDQVCPENMKEEWEKVKKTFKAYIRAFELGKIDLSEMCFYDMVPEDFLKKFCEVKNVITEHVFETMEKPEHYDHLKAVDHLIQKIKYRPLNLNMEGCKNLFISSIDRAMAKEFLNGSPYVAYNIFGTRTGRLTTYYFSFPILTLPRNFRKLIKPKNDSFLSLDYNAAEIRTFLALDDKEQPKGDIHSWNIENIFSTQEALTRDEAKKKFFAWLYNRESNEISKEVYDREALLEKYYKDEHVVTPFKRKMKTSDYKALNYLLQSTTSDIVLEQACRIDEFLKEKKSFIAFVVHDEVVVDLDDSEKDLIPELEEIFAENRLARYKTNKKIGTNYLELRDLE